MKLFPYLSIASLLVLLAGCTVPPVDSAVPAKLVPEGEQEFERVLADGVQIYECRAAPGTPTGASWIFIAPEAELFDARGRVAGKHYAGPHWEALDGSKVVGTTQARADAPQPGAIPWLLVSTRSDGAQGRFAKVTSVQRLNTRGGVAPAETCDVKNVGVKARVPYTADYVMFSATATRSAY
jgi:hypothetical protein